MLIGLCKKVLVLGIIMLFVGAGVIPSLSGTVIEKTTILDTKSGGYIQDLIDNASDGDTINIPSGTYYENIVIDKSINLIGEDRDTTIIYGNGSGDVVKISANKVKISKFMIQNSGDESVGIYIYSNHNIIKDNNINNNGIGIYIYKYRYKPNRNVISGNTISSNNASGIVLRGSNFNSIKGNTITLNNGDGISISYYYQSTGMLGVGSYIDSQFNIIKGNNVSNNERGIFIDNSMLNLIIKNNFFDNEPDAYFENSILNRWILNYWNEKRILPKFIIGKMNIGTGGSEKWINWFNIDWRPALRPYDDISEAENASVVVKVNNSKIKITLTTGGNNYPSNGYSFANSVTIRLNGTALDENNLAGNTGWEIGESLYIGGSIPTLDDEESAIGPLGLGTYDITVTIIETVVFDDSITLV